MIRLEQASLESTSSYTTSWMSSETEEDSLGNDVSVPGTVTVCQCTAVSHCHPLWRLLLPGQLIVVYLTCHEPLNS